MMSKSLTYAYAEGGAVEPELYTPEEIEAYNQANNTNFSTGTQFYKVNPVTGERGIFFLTQQTGYQDASILGNSNEETAAINAGLTFGGGGGGRSGDGSPDSTVYNPNQITSVTQGGIGFSGNPEHFSTTPATNTTPITNPSGTSSAATSYPDINVSPGNVASAFGPSNFDFNAPPPQTYDVMVPSTTAGMYVPPTQQGLGSFSNSVFDGYLMYSNPIMEEFIRPTGG